MNTKVDAVENKIDGNLSKITDGTVSRPGGDVNVSPDLKFEEKDLGIENPASEIPGTGIKLPERMY